LESFFHIDQLLFRVINGGFDPGFLDQLLTLCRNKYFWIPFYIFILSYVLTNYRRSRWLIILFFGITVAISDGICSQLIKKNVERQRPCHNSEMAVNERIHCGHGYSFPSSHACNHFAIGLFLFLLFYDFRYRFILLLWAGLIAICQVYVGVHYPSDVIAGAILGMCIGYVCFSIFEVLTSRLNMSRSSIA